MAGKALVLIFTVLVLAAGSARGQVAVIAHRSVPADTLKKGELRDCFTGERKFWSDGAPVVVYDLEIREGLREAFFSFIGVSSTRIKSIWLKRLFSGDADPPESLHSEDEMLRRTATVPGSIGFVSADRADDTVKVLEIIE